jgi:hypothetical protein
MSEERYDGRAHAGDLLSGLLDDELDQATTAAVVDHVGRCPSCAEDLEGARRARAAVRGLPLVEPPAGFLESLLGSPDVAGSDGDDGAEVVPLRRPSRRTAAAGAAASVAAAVALLVMAVGAPMAGPVEPGVGGAVALHTSALSVLGETAPARQAEPLVYRSTSSTIPWEPQEAVPEPFVAPPVLAGGYELVGSFREGAGFHLLYRSGPYGLSVFERPGRCDFDALPAGGRRMSIGGRDGWRLDTPGIDGRVVVLEHGGLVFVVVGDEKGDAVAEAAASLPGPGPVSTATRLRRAAATSLEHLAPAG